jgi:hypothetical protein
MAIKKLGALCALNAITGVSAFWRMQCFGRTALARVDPVVDYGVPAQHAHSLHGSSGLTIDAEYDDLRAGNCTSCAVSQDMSAYWFPALYFEDSTTKELELVQQVGGLLAYYLLRNPEGDGKVTAFPPGFRMLSGKTNRRQYTLGDPSQPDPPTSFWAAEGQITQDALQQRSLGFNCLNYKTQPEGSLYRHFLPDKTFTDANCPDGIRLEIMFPSCWDGENLDSDDHQSHVQYPSLVGDGECPEGFEVRLITLFYETIWATGDQRFQGRSGRWVLSNGDPTGFGYHADFITGWEEDFLQDAVDRCTNPSGALTDCPTFMEAGPLQTEPEQGQCALEKTDPSIEVSVSLDMTYRILPGDVEIKDLFNVGPDGSDGSSTYPVDESFSPFAAYPTSSASSYAQAPSASASNLYNIYGGAFAESSSSFEPVVSASIVPETTSSTPPPAPATTPAPEVLEEPGVSYEILSTETITSGTMVQEIVYKQAVVYVTEDYVTTTTVPPSVAGRGLAPGHMRRSHLRRHGLHGHVH